jgi:hypothetical protein
MRFFPKIDCTLGKLRNSYVYVAYGWIKLIFLQSVFQPAYGIWHCIVSDKVASGWFTGFIQKRKKYYTKTNKRQNIRTFTSVSRWWIVVTSRSCLYHTDSIFHRAREFHTSVNILARDGSRIWGGGGAGAGRLYSTCIPLPMGRQATTP